MPPPNVVSSNGRLSRSLVLRAVADDYEDFPMAVQEVSKWAAEQDLKLAKSEIANVLVALVEEGLAAAWRLGDSPARIRLTRDSIGDQDVYFIISPPGKSLMNFE